MIDQLRAALSRALGSAYLIERELTEAGTSRLFLANDLAHGRDVVIKVLSAQLANVVHPGTFARAVAPLASLEEQHTLPVYGAGATDDGLIFIIRPLVRNDNLHDRLVEGPIPFDRSIAILKDVAMSMAYAHGVGIVHLDLQPSNILLLRDSAVVADFGIARAVEQSTLPSVAREGRRALLPGSLAFMAPEQAVDNASTDYRTDIYAWGVIAYEMLADAHPFGEPTTAGEFVAAPDLPFKRFGIPEQLATLVMSCLAKNPADRPASAVELLGVLERIPLGADALAIDGRSTVRWIVASILVGLSMFIGVGFTVLRMQRREAQQIPLLAVLPFVNQGDVGDTLFSYGLANALSGKLGKVAGLRVIDRRSILALAGEPDPRAAGKILRAQYVLTGIASWSKGISGTDRIIVTPRIVRVSDGAEWWRGEPETASLPDPFSVQTTLATAVARAYGIEFSPRKVVAIGRRGTNDTAAYSAFTRAILLQRENAPATAAQFKAALREYESAYRRDSLFGDAYGGAGMILALMARNGGTPSLYDSASVLAHRALALAPDQAMAQAVAARVKYAKGFAAGALREVNGILWANPSHVEARKLQAELSAASGDSLGAWSSVELLLAIAPRSNEAYAIATDVAQALRRYGSAGRFLTRARELDPQRNELVLRAATLAKASGDFKGLVTAVRDFRSRGGVLTASSVELLRVGDSVMQRELATSSPASYHVATPADSFTYYAQKALLFVTAHDSARSQTLFDSADVALQHEIADSRLNFSERRMFAEYKTWTDAARGKHLVAVTALASVDRTPVILEWPNGKFAAFTACNAAEVWGFFDAVPKMLPQLRRCLTLPGGYPLTALSTEPSLARHAADPRIRELLAELK